MHVQIPLSRIRRFLALMVVALSLSGILAEAVRHLGGGAPARPDTETEQTEKSHPVLDYFSLSEEANVPTWYSSVLLLSCALVLAFIAAAKVHEHARFRAHWIVLALIFVYMSIDELAQIHEWLNEIAALRGHHGVLYFAWVVPAGILVVVFALGYVRFLLALPRRTRLLVALAGVVYVGGAIGVELVLGKWADLHGEDNLTYAWIDALEETMEMAGSSLFLYALLEYVASPLPDLRISTEA